MHEKNHTCSHEPILIMIRCRGWRSYVWITQKWLGNIFEVSKLELVLTLTSYYVLAYIFRSNINYILQYVPGFYAGFRDPGGPLKWIATKSGTIPPLSKHRFLPVLMKKYEKTDLFSHHLHFFDFFKIWTILKYWYYGLVKLCRSFEQTRS